MIGRVYKIITNCSDEKIYIGSTFKTCEQRWKRHINNYKRWKDAKTRGCYSSFDLFEKYGIDNCRIVLIKQYEVVDTRHLRVYEQLYINKFKAINKFNSFFIRFLSDKDRYKKLLKMRPNYHQERYQLRLTRNPNYNQERYQLKLTRNPNFVKEHYEKYREQELKIKSEKISCECGAIISRGNMSEHKKSKTHFDRLNNQLEPYKGPRVVCDCGLNVSLSNINRHKKSKKHQKLMEKL
jgi:hypothetical protein